MDGITAAVLGALMGAVIIIALRTIKDIPGMLIALFTLAGLIYFKKIKEPYFILLAAVAGIILKLIL